MASIISAGTTDSTSLNVSGDKSGILQLASNNAVTAVTIGTNQYIGVGTTSTSYPFQIGTNPSTPSSSMLLINPVTGTNASYLYFNNNGSGGLNIGRSDSTGAGSGTTITAYDSFVATTGTTGISFHTNNTRAMYIDSGQKVGIGTTSPLAKSHVLGTGTPVVSAGSDGAQEAIIEGANIPLSNSYGNLNIISNSTYAADTGGQIAFAGKSTSSSNAYATWSVIKGAKENGTSGDIASYLAFSTRPNGGGNVERFRIDSTGNSLFKTKRVGLGTYTGNGREQQLISYTGTATNGTITLMSETGFGENGHCGMFFLNVTTAGKGVSRIYFLTGRYGQCTLNSFQGGNRGAGEDAYLQLLGGSNTIGLQLVLSGFSGSVPYFVNGWIGITSTYDVWFSN